MASAKERTLTLSTRKANDVTVELAIEDTGPGIPKALLPTLFQPFRSSKPGGMGIGLSLCRSIIEAHDGRIFCDNTGTGARFWFTLPALKGSGRHD
jgi:two-component system sensor kinase FixL